MTYRNTTIKAHRIISWLAIMTFTLAFSGLSEARVLRNEHKIPGQYIVHLNAEAVSSSPSSSARSYDGLPTVAEMAGRMARRYNGKAGLNFHRVMKGFVIRMNEDDADLLSEDPAVASVEEDGIVTLAGIQENPPSWAVDRLDQRSNVLDGRFVYGDTTNVHIYIIDTGVRSTHAELAGRVDTTNALSLIHDGNETEDTNGHGTAVATVAAGTTLGVAKTAIIHPIRVFGDNGMGSVSNVVYGIDWVVDNRGRGEDSIINLSLQSGPSPSLDEAVRNAVAAGVFVTVAAGNVNDDACGVSPARVSEAFTVGATDSADVRASFSDYGPCVDLFAPGQDVLTAGAWADDATIYYSGTSFSAPFAAGVAAMYLNMNPGASPEEVKWALVNSASEVVTDDGLGSPRGLLYSAFIHDGMDLAPHAAFGFTCRRTRCTFDASASVDDGSIERYSWDFGDGLSASKKNSKVGHRFQEIGTYPVTLIVTDDAGQSSSVVQDVTITN